MGVYIGVYDLYKDEEALYILFWKIIRCVISEYVGGRIVLVCGGGLIW